MRKLPKAAKPESPAVTAYLAALRARMKQLRRDRGLSQTDVAESLQVPRDNYIKWENRSPLPIQYAVPFSMIVGVEVEYLLTGRKRRGPKPLEPEGPEQHQGTVVTLKSRRRQVR